MGPVAYQLELPEELPLKDVEINEKLKFVEQPIQIKDSVTKFLKYKQLKLVKVRWNSQRGP